MDWLGTNNKSNRLLALSLIVENDTTIYIPLLGNTSICFGLTAITITCMEKDMFDEVTKKLDRWELHYTVAGMKIGINYKQSKNLVLKAKLDV